MGPLRVVVDSPCLDDPAGVLQAGEQMLVETLTAQSPVEALHEAVLHRLAGLDVVPFDAAFEQKIIDPAEVTADSGCTSSPRGGSPRANC